MKIGDFRRLVDRLNHSRNDLSGGTREEFRLQNVPARLNPLITDVRQALPEISARFQRDIDSATSAISYAEKAITRWDEAQEQPPVLTAGEKRAKAAHLYLVRATVH